MSNRAKKILIISAGIITFVIITIFSLVSVADEIRQCEAGGGIYLSGGLTASNCVFPPRSMQ